MRLPDFGLSAMGRGLEQFTRALGRLETEVLEMVWRRRELTVRNLYDDLEQRLAYTTLMTTLDRLHKKGLLKRYKAGRAFVYSPALNRAQYGALCARDAIARMLGASTSAQEVFSYFVDAISESDQALLDELERAVKARRKRQA